ncbi:hypothetical protein CCUS01_02767 [Colletotrichum cuscutae]|uniref:Uncharacterized protein n=1 Tax=Colletotrichum cuscutae TaxID=1209917 RepID=A0AAI9YC55_9PEZI|nr:hypothetical protein CCUS01_02767 [Colletotrichum cuscutae]
MKARRSMGRPVWPSIRLRMPDTACPSPIQECRIPQLPFGKENLPVISVHLYGCYVKKDHPSDMLPLRLAGSHANRRAWMGKGGGIFFHLVTIGEETHMWKQAIRQQEGNKVDVPVSQTGETGSRSEDVQLGACRTPNKRSERRGETIICGGCAQVG